MLAFCRVLVAAFLVAVTLAPVTLRAQSAKNIAEDVSTNIGTVTSYGDGKIGASIIVFEEFHADIGGDIEQTIALLRLKKKYRLNDIGLEGYHEKSKSISVDWFANLKDQTADGRFETALSLLNLGEISSPEFMALAFGTKIHRIEQSKDYTNAPPESFGKVVTLAYNAALRRYQNSLDAKSVGEQLRYLRLQNDMSAGKTEAQAQLVEFLEQNEDWLKKILGLISQPQTESALIDRIESEAKSQSVAIDQDTLKALQDNRSFFKARDDASVTMFTSIAALADRPGFPIIAMVIGGAHTAKIASLLRQQDRPFAVISTKSYTKKPTDRDHEVRYRRKFDLLPANNDVVSDQIFRAFPVRIKPQPVVSYDWFQAESELHHALRLAAEAYLGNQQNGPPVSPPPHPFVYKGRKVELSGDVEFDDKGKAVLIKVIFVTENKQSPEVVWAKLSRVEGEKKADQEQRLFEALAAVTANPRPDQAPKTPVQLIQLNTVFKAEVASNKTLLTM
ncbi:hypothetical protein [Bosea sp. BIWAKO-01]|uniref:hypothetical protein n=1 Tax=Bosea sp. BIWAKO-01 TaxID=506668 RepID=UPI00086AD889|nr:hypothetical protein [Bosea sp. BIWAKO-01]GAU82939.1 hypothetical protein BIWAKO_02862 [Bosea sp. BIWAKO-01]